MRKNYGALIVVMLFFCFLSGCSEEGSFDSSVNNGEKQKISPSISNPTGIYLTWGGTGYMVVEKNGEGALEVTDWFDTYSNTDENSLWIIKLTDNKLTLKYSIAEEYVRQMGWTEGVYGIQEMARSSKNVSGDWDMVGIASPFFHFTPEGKVTVQDLMSPVASHLHRLDDQRLVEYFKHFRDDNAPGMLETATGLIGSFPDDVSIRTIYLHALVRNGKIDEAEKEYGMWKSDYESAINPFQRGIPQRVEYVLRFHRLNKEGKNAYNLIMELFEENTDLETQLSRLPEIFNYEECVWPMDILELKEVPSFLGCQTRSKISRIIAYFLMLQGDRQKALELLCANCHLAQLLIGEGTLIKSLIGVALKAITTGGLEVYVLNCCQTREECEEVWNYFTMMMNKWKPVKLDDLLALETFRVQYFYLLGPPNVDEVEKRFNHAHAMFELVRAATAGKYHLIATKRFPQNERDFAPLLKDGLPIDPFGDRLKFISNTDQLKLYSVGPDREDDRGQIHYDASNGTRSKGDVIVTVPRKRKYPFPRNGLKAKNAWGVHRQFPNGLPPDIFASYKGNPLGVTNTSPVYIYSVGPDNDGRQKNIQRPEVMYDPTNGTTSNGDLFIALPAP